MYHLVYKTTHIETGKFYVGVHSTSSVDDGYLGSGRHIKAAIKKYGRGAFKREILRECESKEEAYQVERSIVTREFLATENTYNLAEGGSGHKLYTDSRSKSVLVYDADFTLIHTFPSYKTAADFFGCHSSQVSAACKYSTYSKSSYIKGYYVSLVDSVPVKRDETYLLERNKELWKLNVGRKRPEHGAIITAKNQQRPEAQVQYTFIHTSGIIFQGTRTQLRKAYPEMNILASELANLSNGRAKSTRGWSIRTHIAEE